MSDTELTYSTLRKELTRRVFQYTFSGPLLLVWSLGVLAFLVLFERPLFALVWSGAMVLLGSLMAADYLRTPKIHERLIRSIVQKRVAACEPANPSLPAGAQDEVAVFTEITLKIFQIEKARGADAHLRLLIPLAHRMVSLLRDSVREAEELERGLTLAEGSMPQSEVLPAGKPVEDPSKRQQSIENIRREAKQARFSANDIVRHLETLMLRVFQIAQLPGGPEYLDAITTYEQEVVEFNKNQSGLREPMVSVYPQDGTVIVTHPFAILDGAAWVSPEQVKPAEIFRKFLLSSEQQSLLLKYALRPSNPKASLGSPLEPAYGANPAAKLVDIEMPDTLVFDRVREVWHEVKKHAHIAIVFDKSGSMRGEKISQAVRGAEAFVSAMDPKDWLGWLAFDDEIYFTSKGLKANTGEKLLSDIRSTTAGSGTALYDAVATAFDMVETARKTQGGSVRYGIIVLSDDHDANSRKATMALLEPKLKPSERDPTGIQIHTIGIGADADDAVLKKIANMAHGKYWKVKNPADVVEVYKEIATHY